MPEKHKNATTHQDDGKAFDYTEVQILYLIL